MPASLVAPTRRCHRVGEEIGRRPPATAMRDALRDEMNCIRHYYDIDEPPIPYDAICRAVRRAYVDHHYHHYATARNQLRFGSLMPPHSIRCFGTPRSYRCQDDITAISRSHGYTPRRPGTPAAQRFPRRMGAIPGHRRCGALHFVAHLLRHASHFIGPMPRHFRWSPHFFGRGHH